MAEQTTPIDTDDDLIEDDEIIRAKWTMDNATTLEEAAAKLRVFADQLDELHREGWRLRQPINDDYGFIYQPEYCQEIYSGIS